MNQNNGTVPPLPPRRTISIPRKSPPKESKTSECEEHLLNSVPPPPKLNNDLINFTTISRLNNINDNSFKTQVSRPTLLTNNDFSSFLTNSDISVSSMTTMSTNTSPSIQPYIQWNTRSIAPYLSSNSLFPNSIASATPSMWSYLPNNCINSFTNYSYSSSVGVSPMAGLHRMSPIESISSSMSSPNFSNSFFSNATYSYNSSMPPIFGGITDSKTSLEDIQKLVSTNGQNSHQILVNKSKVKADNNDLIDLIDSYEKSDEDVLQLFDPLLHNIPKQETNNLNFSNDFEDNFEVNDEVDKVVEQNDVVLRKKNIKEVENYFPKKDISVINSVISELFRVKPKKSRANEELSHFCTQISLLRSQYQCNDFNANIGLVISPTLDSQHDKSLSVKLVIETQLSPQPISFTCNVDTSVEHIISHVICTLVEDASQVKMDDYMLKVNGLSEYFAADSVLANYLYVHQCHKFDSDVRLCLVHVKHLNRPFARTQKDDESIDFTADDLIPKSIVCKFGELNAEIINILLENFDREIVKLRSEARISSGQLQSQSIIQTVKAICTHLSCLETISLTESYTNFSQLCNAFGVYKRESSSSEDSTDAKITAIPDLDSKLWEILDHALVKLRVSLTQLIHLFSQTFPVDFDINDESLERKKPEKEICSSMDTLLCYLGVCSQLQHEWLTLYKEFKVRFELIHGENKISSSHSKSISPSKSFFYRLAFDEWLQFDCPLFNLPREVRLEVTLIGIKIISQSDTVSSSPTNSSSNPYNSQEITQDLAMGFICLFDFKQNLSQGQHLIPLWTNSGEFSIETDRKLINSICFERTNPIVHIIFPETDFDIKFSPVVWDQTSQICSDSGQKINSLDSATQTEIFQLLKRNPLEQMSCGDREQLWDRRHYLYECPEALPKVLLASHSWECSSLSDIYSMVQKWSQLSPVDSMQLLLPSFPDIHIRQMTVKWLKKLSLDELCDFLPQLVQALRFDAYIDSPLIRFLLESSLLSVRVCHHLYWILKCNINDPQFAYRSRIYLNSLLAICGNLTQLMFDRQEKLCRQISSICDHVKAAKESQRLNTLLLELETVNDFLVENSTVLPLSPSMQVCGLDVKVCSYFPSNSLPLKLVFKNPDTKTSLSTLEAIFKVGDDLRQDMLSMQMIKIMDKVWLKSGLDLRIITFECIATDNRKGMVEMVRNSETLRKIQLEHGLTGSFKDRPIAEWLQKHNTSELEYHNAVDNFTFSCAGYSVATYILGICDRHNDNIMLTTSGHLFHIDFGKFLGDSQMMAGIKRDRVAFVLTQDMAYVINGGDRPSKQFQFFIDLCCQAFNLLRKNGNFLLSLFSLMMSSHISGLNEEAVKYIHKALMPGLSESEAMSQFTRMIEDSLRSRFTQFNFFIHNLAQLRFTGDHNDQLLLSFVPKKFTKESDGQISDLEIMDCYKKYEPEKVYYYVIRVMRHFQADPSFIHRTYREFLEFHDKLNCLYPLAKFHVLSRSSHLTIRSNTRDVALQRMLEINQFLKGLLVLAHEISHGDIVYTFFHPLLRDQDTEGSTHRTIASLPLGNVVENNNKTQRRESLYGPTITGQIKLSIIYKNMSLVIMIMHAKNLHSPRSTTPDCYVKTYLNPDPNKLSKRKTRVVNKSCHPTFMEMILYHGISLEKVQQKILQVSVWDYDRVTENIFLGATNVILRELNLTNETSNWFPLTGN